MMINETNNKKNDKILNEIAKDLSFYLLNGNLTSFIENIEPNLLNINKIEKILRIHFILTEKSEYCKIGVVDFIKNLSTRMRRIKTIINPTPEILDGEVKGRINWKRTLNLRNKNYPVGDRLYVCDRRNKDYNISENLVLKKLLSIVYNIIFEDLGKIVEKRPKNHWLFKWLDLQERNKCLIDEFFEIFHKNIYLKRISIKNKKITNRMLIKASKSRILIYREASYLLKKYYNLMNFNLEPKEAKYLLKNTFILPERISVLFELYWVIKIIRSSNLNNENNFKFELREYNKNLVANWILDDFEYKIYHDSTGNFKLSEKTQDIKKIIKNGEKLILKKLK
ncbi:hypothetical protein LCGC14_2145350 [marine sediment metagenome]|uniref:Uncharacterized protein n=1 Tax=marine sediment metagenome TaxID=412755 RepID=A0A0F9GA65_9ZZZZ